LGGVELHQRRHSRAAGAAAAALLASIRAPKKKRAVPRHSGAPPEGLAGMAELRPLFPGGAGGAKLLLQHASFLVFMEITAD
jgi:hypothetical protein